MTIRRSPIAPLLVAAFLALGAGPPDWKTPNKPITDIRGRTIWHYEPNEVTGIKEKFDLTFAQGMTSSLLLDRKRLEDYVKAHPETLGIGWKIPGPVVAEGAPEVPVGPTRK